MVPLSSSDDLPLPLLDRYLAGEATAAESAIVEVWIGNSVGRRGELESLRHAVTKSVAALAPGDVDAAVAGVLTASGLAGRVPRTGRPSSESGTKGQSYRLPRLWPGGAGGENMWCVTAVVALVMVALGVGLGVGTVRYRARSGAAAGREYATARGQRLSVTLVDGTQVTLAPASRMRLAADYGGRGETGGSKTRPYGAREVDLEGEAYFTVAHDVAHPFAVRAHGAVARDVGTAFDVRAYPEDAGARIAVAEGAVAVSAEMPRGSRLLSPISPLLSRATELRVGDMATVGQSGVAVERGVDVASLAAWRHGELVFAKAPLREVLAGLGRWYDLDIRLGDAALGDRPVLVASVKDEPVDNVLNGLAVTFGVRLQRTGRLVVFAPVAR